MQKMIEVQWYNEYDELRTGEALVEFTRYNEDGKIINEIIGIFLPEHLDSKYIDLEEVKQQAAEAFHNGEGYEL